MTVMRLLAFLRLSFCACGLLTLQSDTLWHTRLCIFGATYCCGGIIDIKVYTLNLWQTRFFRCISKKKLCLIRNNTANHNFVTNSYLLCTISYSFGTAHYPIKWQETVPLLLVTNCILFIYLFIEFYGDLCFRYQIFTYYSSCHWYFIQFYS